MPSASRLWTADEVRALPDDGTRREVIGGELVVTPAPSWRHGDVVGALFFRLSIYLQEYRIGHVKTAPQEIVFDSYTLVEPDVFVVPLVEGRSPVSWEEAGRLLLAVEVLSPSTARWDRVTKRRLYQSRGVAEYWVVDGDARTIERWRPEDERPEILADRIEWRPDVSRPALEIDLAELFGEATGPDTSLAGDA